MLGPVLVLATINIATAILTEATLSFLGVGVPPTQPSLGTLIRVGNDFLFSGEWWITIFPGAALVVMVLAINLLGDWLRDALNPGCARHGGRHDHGAFVARGSRPALGAASPKGVVNMRKLIAWPSPPRCCSRAARPGARPGAKSPAQRYNGHHRPNSARPRPSVEP